MQFERPADDGEATLGSTIPPWLLPTPDQVCLTSIGHDWSPAGLRNSSATMPGDLRAGS